MTIAKPYKRLFILILAFAAVVVLLFFRMYQDDIKALKAFMASYGHFDKAVSICAGKGRPEALGEANEALVELRTRASLRLSSLIKNDARLMDQACEVADLSRRELDSLGTDGLAEENGALRDKRIAAYTRFQELAGHRANIFLDR